MRKRTVFEVAAQLPSLRRYAGALTRDHAEAEDLVHDALVRAYERRATFRPDRDLRSWLLAILHNIFVDRARRRRSETQRLARVAEIADTASAPAQHHAVRLAQVRARFMTLPEEQRAALHLVAIEDLTYQEAADALGIPVGTLMSRLARARAALRALEASSLEAAPLEDGSPDRRDGEKVRLRVVGGSHDKPD
jgi:RNA polymerase sigma-70 factor (ECF subfamily)